MLIAERQLEANYATGVLAIHPPMADLLSFLRGQPRARSRYRPIVDSLNFSKPLSSNSFRIPSLSKCVSNSATGGTSLRALTPLSFTFLTRLPQRSGLGLWRRP